MGYALDKFISLIEKDNPQIQEVEIPDYYSLNYKKDLTKLGSKIAFTLEDYFTDEAKLDPRYIKTIVRQSGKKNGQSYERFLDYHKCTEADLSKFNQIEP